MYGSITTLDVATALKDKTGVDVKRHQIDMQPFRALGQHVAHVRLTMDLIPDITVIVYREGEANPIEPAPAPKAAAAPVEEAPAAEVPATEAPVAEEQAAAPAEETPAAEA
jgi:hypothetical protein